MKILARLALFSIAIVLASFIFFKPASASITEFFYNYTPVTPTLYGVKTASVTVHRLSFTPNATRNFLIIASGIVTTNSSGFPHVFLDIDNVNYSSTGTGSDTDNNPFGFIFMVNVSLAGNTNHVIRLSLNVSNAVTLASMFNATIMAFDINDTYDFGFYNNTLVDFPTSSTFRTHSNFSFNVPATDNYIIFSIAEFSSFDSNGDANNSLRTVVDGTTTNEMYFSETAVGSGTSPLSRVGGNIYFSVYNTSLSSGDHWISVDGREPYGGLYMRKVSIFALRNSLFRSTYSNTSSINNKITLSSSTVLANVTFADSGRFLVVGGTYIYGDGAVGCGDNTPPTCLGGTSSYFLDNVDQNMNISSDAVISGEIQNATYVWIFRKESLGGGTHTVQIKGALSSLGSSTGTRIFYFPQLFVLGLPNAPIPQWSINQSSISATYSSSDSVFNVTWTPASGESVAVVYVETDCNGTAINYTATNIAGNVWQYSSSLPVCTNAYWKSYGSSDGAVFNTTDTWYFTISKDSPLFSVEFPNGNPAQYPVVGSAQCSKVTADTGSNITIYRNGTMVAQGSSSPQTTSVKLGVDVYNITCTIDSSQNFTAGSSVDQNLVVSSGTPSLSLPITPSNSVPFPTQTTATGSGCPTDGADDVTCGLFRNDASVSNGEIMTFDAGTQTYKYNNTAGANWTSASVTNVTTINKGALAGSSSSQNVNFPINLTAMGNETNTGGSDVVYQEWCNETLMGQATDGNVSGSVQFGVGAYICKLNTTNAVFANYSANASIATSTATISKGALDGSSSSPNVNFPNLFIANGTVSSNIGDTDVNYTLYCGDILMGFAVNSNPSGSRLFGVGSYNCVLNTTSAVFANWTANSSIATSTGDVNKGALDGSVDAPPVDFPNLLVATGTENNIGDTDVNYTLYCGDILMGSAIDGNPSGSYRFPNSTQTCILNTSSDTFANWTANASIASITTTINKGSLSGSISGSDVVFPDPVDVVPSESNIGDDDVNYTFYRNETLVSFLVGSAPSADTSVLAVENYVYKLNTTSAVFANWTESSQITTKSIKVVNLGYTDVQVFIDELPENKTVNYPTSVIVKGNSTSTTSSPDFDLFIDGILQGSGNPVEITILLGAGIHLIEYNTSGNANWTTSTNNSLYVIVNATTTTRILLINGTASDIYIQVAKSWRGFAVNITACKTVKDETLTLLKNGTSTGTQIGNCTTEINTTMPKGVYNFTVDMTQANYTSSPVTFLLYVRDEDDFVPIVNETASTSWNASTNFTIDWFGTTSNATINITVFRNNTDSNLNYTLVKTDFTTDTINYQSYWNNLTVLQFLDEFDFNNPTSNAVQLYQRTPYVRSYSNTKEILISQNRWTFDFIINMTLNETRSQELAVVIPKSPYLNEWGTGTTTLSSVSVDGSVQNISYAEDSSNVIFMIGSLHGSSSLEYGSHTGEIVYLVSTGTGGSTPLAPPSSGGGGGGCSVEGKVCSIDKDCCGGLSCIANISTSTKTCQITGNVTAEEGEFRVFPVELFPPTDKDILPNTLLNLTTPITVQNIGNRTANYQSYFTCPSQIDILTGKETPVKNCADKWCYIVGQSAVLKIPPKGYATYSFECKVDANATIGETYKVNFCISDMATKKEKCVTISLPIKYASQAISPSSILDFFSFEGLSRALGIFDYGVLCFAGSDPSECFPYTTFPYTNLELGNYHLTKIPLIVVIIIAVAVIAVVFKKKPLWIVVLVLLGYELVRVLTSG